MNSPPDERQPPPQRRPKPDGLNLFVLYGLLALGMLAAAAIAAMIVWPFYLRR